MSKLHRYRIPRWPHDVRTAIFRWSPDFLTSDGDRQVPRQSPLDDLPIAVGASAEISVIRKVNWAAAEQSPGGGRQTSGAWLLRPGSRSKKSGDHLPMPQNRNRRKIGGSPHDFKSLWRSYYKQGLSVIWLLNLVFEEYCFSFVSVHCAKRSVTTMLTYPWKCTVLHCNHLGNTWKPLVLMT